MTLGVARTSARQRGIRKRHNYCEQVKPGDTDTVLQGVIVLLGDKRIGVTDPRVLLQIISDDGWGEACTK